MIYANQNVNSKLYKISTLDVCGTEGQKSPFHHTIKLNDQQNGNFDWNFYDIQGQTTPVLQYILLRDSVSSGIWRTIAITSGNVNQVSDPDYNLYPNSSYRVITNLGNLNCTPTMRTLAGYNTSRSNIKNRTVGIKDESNFANDITLVPNPASSTCSIMFPLQEKISSIYFIDNTGRVVNSISIQDNNTGNLALDISNLASGFYTLAIQGNNFRVNKKLVKN